MVSGLVRASRLDRAPGGEQFGLALRGQAHARAWQRRRGEFGGVEFGNGLLQRAGSEPRRISPGRVRRVDVALAVAARPERKGLSRLAELGQEVRVDPDQS